MKLQRWLLQNDNAKQAERITKRAINIAKRNTCRKKNAKVGRNKTMQKGKHHYAILQKCNANGHWQHTTTPLRRGL